MEPAIAAALILAQHTDQPEAHLLIAADRLLVGVAGPVR
jgi:hypothetical protein